MPIRAVLFDFGGVILTSPFEAFARYEAANGLPDGFLRAINARNPDDNAWARLERNEVDMAGFCAISPMTPNLNGQHVKCKCVLTSFREPVP